MHLLDRYDRAFGDDPKAFIGAGGRFVRTQLHRYAWDHVRRLRRLQAAARLVAGERPAGNQE